MGIAHEQAMTCYKFCQWELVDPTTAHKPLTQAIMGLELVGIEVGSYHSQMSKALVI